MARRQRLDRHHEHQDSGRPQIGRAGGPSAATAAAPPAARGASGLDQHTLMVRRRVAAGVALVALIVIVLVVNGCLKSQKQQSLKNYNHDVSRLAQESVRRCLEPLFVGADERREQAGARSRGADQPAAHPGAGARQRARRA